MNRNPSVVANMFLKTQLLTIVALSLLTVVGVNADGVYIRVNQIGYQPRDAKVAVAMGRATLPDRFQLIDPRTEKIVYEGKSHPVDGTWGEFNHHVELDFSAFEK